MWGFGKHRKRQFFAPIMEVSMAHGKQLTVRCRNHSRISVRTDHGAAAHRVPTRVRSTRARLCVDYEQKLLLYYVHCTAVPPAPPRPGPFNTFNTLVDK
jgi:hypothetical protein